MFPRLLLILGLLFGATSAPGSAFAQQPPPAASQAEDLFQLGYAHFEESRFAEARAAFESALRLDPAHRQARAYLVECLVLEGDTEAATAVAANRPRPSEEPPGEPRIEGPTPDMSAPPTDASAPPADDSAPPTDATAPYSEEEAARMRADAAARQAEAQARHAREAAEREQADAQRAAARAERDAAEAAARADSLRLKKEARRLARNPRRVSHLAAGLGIGGAAATVGVFAELRPTWLGSGVFGLGGFLVQQNGDLLAALALSGEVQLSPVPWRLTPLVGAGLLGFVGSGAHVLDNALWSLPTSRDALRIVPYALLGLRYDFKKRLWFSLSARLAPSPVLGVMPMPGLRLGLRF